MRSRPTYEDLALKIELAPDGGQSLVRVLHSPFGHCEPAAFRLPLADQDPPRILRFLGESIWRSGRGVESARNLGLATTAVPQTPFGPQEIGRALFETLFVDQIRENLLSTLALVGSRTGTGLRIRLVFDPVVSDLLSSWPWELLYRHETRDYLGRDLRTPIVRQLEVRRPALTPTPISQLRILVVLSDPTDLTRLNVEREKTLIEAALDSVDGVELRFLERPTIELLRTEVREHPFDVLHFIGHGDLDQRGHGTVMFEDADRQARAVSGTVLADTLKGLEPVRLVFLNACETARLPRDSAVQDPYVGAASALVMAGIPAVVAMQFPISDGAALTFSNAFYRNLAAGDPLEGAVTEGRIAIFHARPESWEWATPVLFLGVPNGDLFTVAESDRRGLPQPGQAAEAKPSPTERVLDLFERRHYDAACAALEKAREADPEDARLPYYQALARLQGRRPRTARLDVVRRIEADLETASYLSPEGEPAHFWFLQALLKEDFYGFKGLRIKPPAIDQVLNEARAAPAEPRELERLLDHVPIPPSPVRSAIEARLQELAGE